MGWCLLCHQKLVVYSSLDRYSSRAGWKPGNFGADIYNSFPSCPPEPGWKLRYTYSKEREAKRHFSFLWCTTQDAPYYQGSPKFKGSDQCNRSSKHTSQLCFMNGILIFRGLTNQTRGWTGGSRRLNLTTMYQSTNQSKFN